MDVLGVKFSTLIVTSLKGDGKTESVKKFGCEQVVCGLLRPLCGAAAADQTFHDRTAGARL